MRISGSDGGRPVALDERCAAISLALADSSVVQWELRVYAVSPDGPARVCTFQTTAPSAGSGETRWIGFASVPGAVSWYVEAYVWERTGDLDSKADLFLAAATAPVGFVGGFANGTFAVLVG